LFAPEPVYDHTPPDVRPRIGKDSIMLTAQAIKNQHSDIFTFLHGDLEIGASHCHVPEEASLGTLDDSPDA